MGSEAGTAISLLIERLGDRDEQIRTSSLRALARMGNLPSEARGKLLPFLEDTNAAARAGAAVALMRLNPNDPAAIAVISDCLKARDPPNLRSSTLFLMMGMGSTAKTFLPELRTSLADTNSSVARCARKLVMEIDPENLSREK